MWCRGILVVILVMGSFLWMTSTPLEAKTALHVPWHTLLQRYVREGLVDYRGLQAASTLLIEYLAALKAVELGTLKRREDQLALWINAYNACVVKGVLDHYPIRSVKDVKGFFDRLPCEAAGFSLTLNEIEAKGRALGDWRI